MPQEACKSTHVAMTPLAIGALESDGFVVLESIIEATEITRLTVAIAAADGTGIFKRDGSSYALRNLFELAPAIERLARSKAVRRIVEPALGPTAFAVRALLFDKISAANWKVPWHQDLTIEVSQRKEAANFGPWSIKAGIDHVQAPVGILQNMLAVRIHLDDCDESNGPLRVVPGSHRHGRSSVGEIVQLRETHGETTLAARRGDAIAMRPLLVHASSIASNPAHRRVVHLEFAATPLPSGLQWRSNVGSD
jgi:hypothetical protein